MRRFSMFLLALLIPIAVLAATPTKLYIVDLRWIAGEPELETWLGSLQGALNRQEDDSAIFLVANEGDNARAEMLARTFKLTTERFTPQALLEREKAALTGQVLYDPAEPWTRNIALSAAAVLPGVVIATEKDLGLPTTLDLRHRWANRLDAYTWAIAEYDELLAKGGMILAPESGHLLADLIVSGKYLAVDLNPRDADEAAILRNLLDRLPQGSALLGSLDDRCGAPEDAFITLTELLRGSSRPWVPARDAANLSCFARFPATRPLAQGRDEFVPEEGRNALALIYDGGDARIDGSQSLDYALTILPRLLDDPAMRELPVGIQVPAPLLTYAPALYQSFIARQRFTAAELIAAPNGNGWALPMLMSDATPYLNNSTALARQADLTGLSLFDQGEQARYQRTLAELANRGWRGAMVRPVPIESLPDQHRRSEATAPGFAALVGAGRIASVDELRAALARMSNPFNVLYLDPNGLPPATLRLLLPEIEASHTLLTPSQAFRAMEEYAQVMPWLKEQQQQNPKRTPKRNPPTLAVSTPYCAIAPTADQPIPVTVRITGQAPVVLARLIYQAPDGRLGAADLRNAGNEMWTAVLPPMLIGGTLSIRARVVEGNGFGISISEPLTLAIPIADGDSDGLDDTLEVYQGSDPARADTDSDGLPDGLDGHPTRPDRDIFAYFAPITPPADVSMLVEAGDSTADLDGRLIPAGKSVVYRIPLADLPGAWATLRVESQGAGSITLNSPVPLPLEVMPDQPAITDVPLSTATPLGKELTVRVTAGDTPLRLLSLGLVTNPNGPYILPSRLTPAFPPAGTSIPLEVTAYSPQGIKAVRARFAARGGALTTLALTPVDGSAATLFRGEIPAQANNTQLIYAVEAEDTAGNVTVAPFNVAPIGRTRKHTTALIGGRDLRGGWQPAAIWGETGRVLSKGQADDHHLFLTRPGTYYAWILAQPRVRGLAVSIEERNPYTKSIIRHLSQTVAGGSPDGWRKLGKFTADESKRLHVTVTPVGADGYVAYGTVVLTQDETFTPPLTHAGLDWYNSITLLGLQPGQEVRETISVNVLSTGNLDAINVTAEKVGGGGIVTQKVQEFTRRTDGSYTLDTRGLTPGEYRITASGYRITKEPKGERKDALVSASVRVVVKGR